MWAPWAENRGPWSDGWRTGGQTGGLENVRVASSAGALAGSTVRSNEIELSTVGSEA